MSEPRFDSEEYDEYLQSDEWAELRDRVLERDDWLCQGCLVNEATQVHHLTYKNVFEEFAWELKSICEDCHRRVHGLPPIDRSIKFTCGICYTSLNTGARDFEEALEKKKSRNWSSRKRDDKWIDICQRCVRDRF